MVKLIDQSPCAGLLPIAVGSLTLSEILSGVITSVMPLKGQDKSVSEALKAAIGAGLPQPGRSTGTNGALVLWSGQGQALVLGAKVSPKGAAVTDQSDGWACMALDGAGGREVLARLMPVDLRASVFAVGHVARTLLGHMPCVLRRTGPENFEIMVFRSMARTAVHELEFAMKSVTAQS